MTPRAPWATWSRPRLDVHQRRAPVEQGPADLPRPRTATAASTTARNRTLLLRLPPTTAPAYAAARPADAARLARRGGSRIPCPSWHPSDRSAPSPGDHQPQPAAPGGPLAGRAPGVAAAPRGGRHPSWSTSGTAPRRSPRSSCTRRLRRVRADVRGRRHRDRPGTGARGPAAGAGGADVRGRRLRGAAGRRRRAGGRAGLQRAAPVRRGRGRAAPGRRSAPRLAPGGLLVDGTCDELGRRSTWVAVDGRRPALADPVAAPGRAAAPVGGRRAAAQGADPPQRARRAGRTASSPRWTRRGRRQAPHASYGARQRFLATAATVRGDGWPVLDGPSRWRLGELTVAWSAVAPR